MSAFDNRTKTVAVSLKRRVAHLKKTLCILTCTYQLNVISMNDLDNHACILLVKPNETASVHNIDIVFIYRNLKNNIDIFSIYRILKNNIDIFSIYQNLKNNIDIFSIYIES